MHLTTDAMKGMDLIRRSDDYRTGDDIAPFLDTVVDGFILPVSKKPSSKAFAATVAALFVMYAAGVAFTVTRDYNLGTLSENIGILILVIAFCAVVTVLVRRAVFGWPKSLGVPKGVVLSATDAERRALRESTDPDVLLNILERIDTRIGTDLDAADEYLRRNRESRVEAEADRLLAGVN